MEQTKGQIIELIPKIMKEVGAIGKGRRNQQQNYSFRGIDDAFNALHGPLSDAGVFFVPELMESSYEERTVKRQSGDGVLIYARLKVKYTFFAPDGSFITATVPGEAMDSGDKATNKAMSAALKYALLQIFCIPTEEDKDTENGSPEPAPKTQQPRAAVKQPAKEPAGEKTPGDREMKFLADFDAAIAKRKIGRDAGRDAIRTILKKKNKSLSELTDENLAAIVGMVADKSIDKFIPVATQKKAA